MKKWAFLTITLYLLCLSILLVPLFLLFSKGDWELISWYYIFIVPVLVLVQAVLLLVPIDVTLQRPIARRKIAVSALVTAIPMMLLVFMFCYSVILMLTGEQGEDDYIWFIVGIAVFSWLMWGWLFYRNYSSDDPGAFTKKITRWLMRGSILELIVAVPSHIISRQREECCAPIFTLIGIATGLAIALLYFGPSIYFLFAKKIKEKKGD
ncbi:MAG: hypothetical protein L3J52_01740 [Proteobacteria bacterium]|nr:hypothetical protein [Pseudomonadota bacterium]